MLGHGPDLTNDCNRTGDIPFVNLSFVEWKTDHGISYGAVVFNLEWDG